MNMKTVYALLTTVLLGLGSTAVLALGWGDKESDGLTFSTVDQNSDGVIDNQEARSAGISDSLFKSMDKNEDGVLTESEYKS